MTDKTRSYRMMRRAQSQRETRRRITESAVDLHGTVGPSKTSISAVAAHAGVRRSTVYRHFPDEAALFDACTSHWYAKNPPPEIAAWSTIETPEERLTVALGELYAYYRRTECMLDNVFRDATIMPLVQEHLTAFMAYFGGAQEMLMAGRRLRGAPRRRSYAAIGHAIAFSSWRSLVRDQGLSDADAVRLMSALVAAAGDPGCRVAGAAG
jgi:AcrR family transcriptional regulator